MAGAVFFLATAFGKCSESLFCWLRNPIFLLFALQMCLQFYTMEPSWEDSQTPQTFEALKPLKAWLDSDVWSDGLCSLCGVYGHCMCEGDVMGHYYRSYSSLCVWLVSLNQHIGHHTSETPQACFSSTLSTFIVLCMEEIKYINK